MLIYDEEKIRQFVSILKPLENTEIYMVSLAARTKYLPPELKAIYDLGRSEMLEYKTVRSKEKFLRNVYKLDCNMEGYSNKDGSSAIPDICKVVYVNIHPCNTLRAYQEFQRIMNEYVFELSNNALNGANTENVISRINKLDRLMFTSLSRAYAKKIYIDIDFDIGKENDFIAFDFCSQLKEKDIDTYLISSKSGFHIMIDKTNLKFNYTILVEEANEKAKKINDKFEVIVNKNEMCPLPGTLQGGYKVDFWKFE